MEKRSCLYLLLFCTLFGAVEAQSEITLTLSPQKYAALPGDLFPVDYIVAWTGEPHAYTVLPPVLPALDWGTATLLKMQAKRDGERHETHLIIGYQAQDAGTYTVPAFDIRLLEGSGDAEDRITAVDETLPTQVVEAAAIEIVFRPSRAGLWIGGIGSGLLLFGGLLWYRARKNRGKETDTPTRSPLEEAQAMLHEARRNRLDGDFYGFYRALHGALTYMETNAPGSQDALLDKLRIAADDTGYRGIRPSDDRMEGDFKEVERLVAQQL